MNSGSLAHLRLVSINDVYDIGKNLPRLQTFLSQLSPKPSAVVVCGDFLSPSTLSSIDSGRGMVATLRTVGVTHVTLGNHEQDLGLESLRDRLQEISAPQSSSSPRRQSPVVEVVNSNMQHNLPLQAEWVRSVTKPYSIIQTPCGKVRVALLGLISDEPGIFRDNTFKSIPIQNILESFTEWSSELTQNQDEVNDTPKADLIIPLTHESIVRDKDLAQHMLMRKNGPGLILGGHEHEPYEITVWSDINGDFSESTGSPRNEDDYVCIFKSGMDADYARVVDLTFEVPTNEAPRLINIQHELIHMQEFEPSSIARQVVNEHLSVIQAMDNEVIVDANAVIPLLPMGFVLSSERTRYKQTTVGSILCQMMKDQFDGQCDIAMINGATIKGGKEYPDGKISYAELKNELPFPTKIVLVPMKSHEVYDAIHYSRTRYEDGTDVHAKDVARRGYLQIDFDWTDRWEDLGHSNKDTLMLVALPRNLLTGFCKIAPLMSVGERLMKEGMFPGPDDFVPAMDLVVRHACKNKWYQLVGGRSFRYFDLNDDGVLDQHEVRSMLKEVLGYEPMDFVVQDMIAAIDSDHNGVIDQGEFSYLLAQLERNNGNFLPSSGES